MGRHNARGKMSPRGPGSARFPPSVVALNARYGGVILSLPDKRHHVAGGESTLAWYCVYSAVGRMWRLWRLFSAVVRDREDRWPLTPSTSPA